MKKVLKVILWVLLAIVVLAAALIAWLSITEYKPAPVEQLSVTAAPGSQPIDTAQTLEILSWNIGYAGLGEGSEFFMDGGKDVKSADRATVEKYLSGIRDYIYSDLPDFVMLQEVDVNSTRTYGIDQAAYLAGFNSVHALNYACPFVPYPVPPMGKINSGLFTISQHEISSAERQSLPCPFSWPVRAANIKRCLLVSYLPIEGSDKQLVLVNLHLEAYDDGEGKIAQTNQLRDFISAEYEKGNYVIAGGDFNQTFPGSLDTYPILNPELWTPGVLDNSLLPQGWSFVYDVRVPTCRLLNQPYDPSDVEHTQHYVIDGFIISPNVELKNVESIDLGFENSDHNPVRMTVELNAG